MQGLNPNWLPGKATERHGSSDLPNPQKPVLRENNYGRCTPWLSRTETPIEYTRTMLLLRAMGNRRVRLSHAEWALEMALRAVRHSDTQEEMDAAVAKLKAARQEHDILAIDWTFNVANMPNNPEVESIGDAAEDVVSHGNGHTFCDGCGS